MKIVKTKSIIARNISEIPDNLAIFRERLKLHKSSPPKFFVYIQDYAWNAFVGHGENVYKEVKHEAQGIFVGHYFQDKFGEFVVATNYEEGNGNSQSAYVEMSEECLAKISERCQKSDTLMLIWVHTHPGFGVFYSGTDYNCLKTNFYKPNQIGIVVDILKGLHKGFKTKGSEVIEFSDYALFNEARNNLFSPYENQKKQSVGKYDLQIDDELIQEVERLKCKVEKLEKEIIELKKENVELKKRNDELNKKPQVNRGFKWPIKNKGIRNKECVQNKIPGFDMINYVFFPADFANHSRKNLRNQRKKREYYFVFIPKRKK